MSGDYNQVLDDIKLDMDIETIKLDDIELEEIDSETPVELGLDKESDITEPSSVSVKSESEEQIPASEEIGDSSINATETLDIIEDSPEPDVPSPTGEETIDTPTPDEETVPVLDLSEKSDNKIDPGSDISIPNFSLDEVTEVTTEDLPQETTNEEIPLQTNKTESESAAAETPRKPENAEEITTASDLFDSDDEIISIDGRDLDRIIYGEENISLSPEEMPSEPIQDIADTNNESEQLLDLSDEQIPDIEETPAESIKVPISEESSESEDQENQIGEISIIEEDIQPEKSPTVDNEDNEELVQVSDIEKSDELSLQHDNFELSVEADEELTTGDNTVPPLTNEPTVVLRENLAEPESEPETDTNDEPGVNEFNFDLSVIPDVTEIDEDEPISLSMDELNNIDVSGDLSETPSEEEMKYSSSAPLSQEEPDLDSVQVEEADEIEIPLPVEMDNQSDNVIADKNEAVKEIEIEIPPEEILSETSESVEISAISGNDEPIEIIDEEKAEKVEIPTDLSEKEKEISLIDQDEIVIKESSFNNDFEEKTNPNEDESQITDTSDLERIKEVSDVSNAPDNTENQDSIRESIIEEEIPISESDFNEISNIEMQDDEAALTDTDLEVMIEKEPQIPQPTPQAEEPELAENEEHVEIALDELDEIQSEFGNEEPVASSVYQTEPETIDTSESSKKSNRELIEEKMDGLSNETKEELKTVLKYLDNLLEDLPDSKIKEFSESKYYDLYIKILDKLGV